MISIVWNCNFSPLHCSSSVQNRSLEVIHSGQITVLERKSFRHEFSGILSFKRYHRSLQYRNQTTGLPFYVLLLQQPEIILRHELSHFGFTRLLCDWYWLYFRYLLPTKLSTIGMSDFCSKINSFNYLSNNII